MTSRLPRVRILILTLLSLFIPMQSRSQGFPWYTIPLPIPNGFVDAAAILLIVVITLWVFRRMRPH